MSEATSGTPVLPLWPEREYPERDWPMYEPSPIELEEALSRMFPLLRERGILPGVFFTVESGSIDCSLDKREKDLRTEMGKYS